jgi:hypothetical protein
MKYYATPCFFFTSPNYLLVMLPLKEVDRLKSYHVDKGELLECLLISLSTCLSQQEAYPHPTTSLILKKVDREASKK